MLPSVWNFGGKTTVIQQVRIEFETCEKSRDNACTYSLNCLASFYEINPRLCSRRFVRSESVVLFAIVDDLQVAGRVSHDRILAADD